MAEKISVKIGGAYKDVTSAHVKLSGAWKKILTGYAKIGGAWVPIYRSWPFEALMTVGENVGTGNKGFLDSAYVFGLTGNAMSDVTMPGATLRALIVASSSGTTVVRVGRGAAAPYGDPGAGFIRSVQVGAFPLLEVGGANYARTSYSTAVDGGRSWIWNTEPAWVAGQQYSVLIEG